MQHYDVEMAGEGEELLWEVYTLDYEGAWLNLLMGMLF